MAIKAYASSLPTVFELFHCEPHGIPDTIAHFSSSFFSLCSLCGIAFQCGYTQLEGHVATLGRVPHSEQTLKGITHKHLSELLCAIMPAVEHK